MSRSISFSVGSSPGQPTRWRVKNCRSRSEQGLGAGYVAMRLFAQVSVDGQGIAVGGIAGKQLVVHDGLLELGDAVGELFDEFEVSHVGGEVGHGKIRGREAGVFRGHGPGVLDEAILNSS